MLGVDLFALYNRVTDWGAVRAGGVEAAIIKLTNGTGQATIPGDGYVAGARGVDMAVGGYHYALGSTAPAAQAEAFAAEVARLRAWDLAPALDYEDSSLPYGPPARAWIVEFFVAFHALLPQLTRVTLYSSSSWLSAMDAGSIAVPGLEILIWDAEYGVNDGLEHPIRAYPGAVAAHQFTSVGHVAGIEGAVDLDDIIDLAEDTMPTAQEIADCLLDMPIQRYGRRADGSDGPLGEPDTSLRQILQWLGNEFVSTRSDVEQHAATLDPKVLAQELVQALPPNAAMQVVTQIQAILKAGMGAQTGL